MLQFTVCAIALALSLLTLMPTTCFSDTPKTPVDKTSLQTSAAAAQSWLELIDRGQYGESWDKASGLMRLTIHKDEWQTFLNKVRKPLGSVISRQVLDQRVAKDPHGLPRGDYMVMFYKTAFSGKRSSNELVTLFNEDGDWRVMTYQVD